MAQQSSTKKAVSKSQGRPSQIGFIQAIRDVLLASINRGQLLLLLMGVGVLVAIVRMTPEDLGKLANRLLDVLEKHHLLGYIFSFLALIAWFIHAKYQRQFFREEMERLSQERNQLQEQALGTKVKSSQG